MSRKSPPALMLSADRLPPSGWRAYLRRKSHWPRDESLSPRFEIAPEQRAHDRGGRAKLSWYGDATEWDALDNGAADWRDVAAQIASASCRSICRWPPTTTS